MASSAMNYTITLRGSVPTASTWSCCSPTCYARLLPSEATGLSVPSSGHAARRDGNIQQRRRF
eukprot:2576748-Heterocapsa_arctica.AAC.1